MPKRMSGVNGAGTFDDAAWVAMGLNHGCAVRAAGNAVCWGEDDNGRTGDDDGVNDNAPAPVLVANSAGYREVRRGARHVVRSANGRHRSLLGLRQSRSSRRRQHARSAGTHRRRRRAQRRARGRRVHPQLCRDGRWEDLLFRRQCARRAWSRRHYRTLGASARDDLVRRRRRRGRTNRHVRAPRQRHGRVLGSRRRRPAYADDRPTIPAYRTAPVGVTRICANVRAQLAAGEHHACAIVDTAPVGDGVTQVWCWGYNAFGQLGDGTVNSNATPVRVLAVGGFGTLDDAVAIGAGWNHTCAVRANGQVACWGYNGFGQIGDNSVIQRPFPVAVGSPLSAFGSADADGNRAGVGPSTARPSSRARSPRAAACSAGATARTASSRKAQPRASHVPVESRA